MKKELEAKKTHLSSLKCIIDKKRHIYDEEFPHLLEEVHSLREGNYINALVRENQLKSDFFHISLSLLNSKLRGSKQESLIDGTSFFRLGKTLDIVFNRDIEQEVKSLGYFSFENLVIEA